MPARIFACYECEDNNPCVLIADAELEYSPEHCPFKGKSVWREMKTEEVVT